MRLCLDCGRPVRKNTGARCETHARQKQRARDKRRGSTTARGYGAPHQAVRRTAIAQLQPGQPCAHCGNPIHPGQAVDQAHTPDRSRYIGLAHARCNRQDGAATANRNRKAS